MSENVVQLLGSMTGEQIAEWCAKHGQMVIIEYHTRKDGSVQPVIRAHHEPSFAVDLKRQVRGDLDER